MFIKEDLLSLFLSGKISLSQIDFRFFNNLRNSINAKKGITTNQAALFDKLINKYARQLRKNEIVVDKALSLPWKTKILDSDKQFTVPTVTIDSEENTIIVKTPFNNKFIKTVNQDRRFPRYNKDKRCYIGSFSTNTFKAVVNRVNEHFASVVYCPTATNILEQLKQYEAKFYNPTLVDLNGNLVVMACTPALANILEKVKIERTPECFEELLMMGITVDETVWKDDEKLKFAGSLVYELNNMNIEKVVAWLNELGYSGYVITRPTERLKIKGKLVEELEKTSMKFHSSFWRQTSKNNKLVVFTHTILTGQSYLEETSNFRKIIVVKDSTKVEVK